MLYSVVVALINKIKKLKIPEEQREKNPLIKKVISNPRCIVVSRLQNIGDMVVFIPSLIQLRKLYPEAEILLLGKHKSGIETIKGAPFIDGIVEVGSGSIKDKLRLFAQLRKKKVDLFIVSSQDQGRVPWALFSGAKVIVAFDKVKRYGREAKEKLKAIISIRVKYEQDLSDAENNLRLIYALGNDLSDVETRFDWVEEEEKKFISQELDNIISKTKGPLIVFSPGTKRPSRAWPIENFRKLAYKLNREFNAQIILIGTKGQKAQNKAICNGNHFILDFSGKTSICGMGYLLSKVDLVISVDSGPMHVAAAVGVPMVALFGPGDYKTWKPYCKNPHVVSILHKAPECAPCLHYKCPKKYHECMESISVEAVYSEAKKLLYMTRKIRLVDSEKSA